ncbi:DUF2515 domain-containing protein [Ectobacillus ponti]|uniref:DUF2515 domain-containing protein n=1 Tax=Ectobacillus ponti TaxID=2961894 RepID=A0AA41X4U9_9BACI|nr:DUF2515 domain-containing protein [Ectobacillus ponti]MCP8968792.1 DUF2515 domain-containing protein [Ectobacillus ponti]
MYTGIQERRKIRRPTAAEHRLLAAVRRQTEAGNADNITRTHAYQEYYRRQPEIRWAFLASMVSRNAGWNMTDLEGKYFPRILSDTVRKRLFLTYERANWFIFDDAYPQLLLYEYSKRENRPLFHLLAELRVSAFMEGEWERFWQKPDLNRLMTALIINEQNMIQKPVIEHPYFQKHVFHSLLFKFQELFHFSSVLFPTEGGRLYGLSVQGFEDISNRIDLGKRLAWLLFHPDYQESFQLFSDHTVHTGSRTDYEQYLAFHKNPDTPQLRDVFPMIPHQRSHVEDWWTPEQPLQEWFSFTVPEEEPDITEHFLLKQKQLHLMAALEGILHIREEM